jgi:hypothetical protein
LDGAGVTGDSIGTTGGPCMAGAGTTPGAARSTTGAIFTVEVLRAADLAPAPSQGMPPDAAKSPTVQAKPLGLSMETTRLLAGTRHPAVRLAPARGPSAGTLRADRRGAILHAEAPALVMVQREAVEVGQPVVAAEEDLGAAVAGVGNRFAGGGRATCKLNASSGAWSTPESCSPEVA